MIVPHRFIQQHEGAMKGYAAVAWSEKRKDGLRLKKKKMA